MAVVAEMGCILGRRRRGRRPKREIACWKSSSTILQFSAIKAILERSEPAKAPVASSLGIRLKVRPPPFALDISTLPLLQVTDDPVG
jgi:hypothetical protein